MTPERLKQITDEAEERYPDGGNMYHTKREAWIAARKLSLEEREKELGWIKQELKEFDAYFDHLSQGFKDAGNGWIAFTDKFNAFKKKLFPDKQTFITQKLKG